MNIDSLLKLVHLCNVVHFPQGVVVERHNGGFRAGIVTKADPYFPQASSTNKTPDGALDDLKSHVHNAAKNLAAQKHNEAMKVHSEIQAAIGGSNG